MKKAFIPNKKSLSVVVLFIFIIALIFNIETACSKSNISQLKLLNNNSELKLAQISDVHFDTHSPDNAKRLYSYSSLLLEDAVNQINKTKDIDVVLFTGDMINRPDKSDLEKFTKVANKLNVPWYAALGNHDIGIGGPLSKKVYFSVLKQNNKNIPDGPYYIVSPKKGYSLIAMDGVIDTKITANGYFSNEQLKWLDNQLNLNKNNKVIIFEHFPIVEPYKSESHYVINADQYQKILENHKNVLALLSGHYHAAKITKAGNMVHISTPALVEYPNAFRIITINDVGNKIKLDVELKETGLKNLQQMSKSRAGSPSLAIGEEKDRDSDIYLNKF